MNSFASIKSPGNIVAEILMLSTSHSGGFLLVEGDEDSRFWSSRSKREKCQIVISGGKDCTEKVAIQLDSSNNTRVVGVIDADFDRITGRTLCSDRLVTTDCHDLETMLLASNALDRVLCEYADSARVAQFESKEGKTVRECVLLRAHEFAKLRLISRQQNYCVDFDTFSPHKYCDAATWEIDIQKLHADFCKAANISGSDLVSLLGSIQVPVDWDMAQGHDALRLLSIGLKAHFGTSTSMGHKDIAAKLRIAYDNDELHATGLYQSLLGVLHQFRWSLG